MLNYIMLAAVLAITLFMASKSQGMEIGADVKVGNAEIAILNWYLEDEIAYLSPEIVKRAIAITEQVYNDNFVSGGLVKFVMAPFGVIDENIFAYYDYRMQMVVINPERFQELDSTYKIYLIAHELGHHFLRNTGVNDHCLMYLEGDPDVLDYDGGYDHKVLQLMGVPRGNWGKYIDPFTAMYACGGDY